MMPSDNPPQPSSFAGAAIEAGTKVASSLPGQFLALLLMNVVFILGLLAFLDRQERQRVELYGPILTTCIRGLPGK
jgi:hypothetical protein